MGIFGDKTDYVDLGKNGKPEEVILAYNKRKKDSWDNSEKNNKLIEGATKAFRAGRPDNFQCLILNIKKTEASNYDYSITRIISKLSNEGGDKLADLNLAIGGIPQADRQDLLDRMLNRALVYSYGGEPFYALLLQAGANVNAEIDGYKGVAVLAKAIQNRRPLTTIQLLHNAGATFDDAEMTMNRVYGYTVVDIERLRFYREQIEGKPAPVATAAATPAADAYVNETLKLLVQEMIEMREEITKLRETVAAQAPKAAPSKPTAPKDNGKKIIYPKAF